MKNKLSLVLLLTFMLIMVGCSGPVEEPEVNNVVKPAELTEGQKEIVTLLATESMAQIYDFSIDSSYDSIELWIDEYDNGVYVKTRSRMSAQLNSTEGKIAIVRDNNLKGDWKISVKSGGSIGTYYISPEPNPSLEDKFSLASGHLSNPVSFKSDDTIILGSLLFDEDNSIAVYEPQHYVENPEALKENNYAFLIKCKFINKSDQ